MSSRKHETTHCPQPMGDAVLMDYWLAMLAPEREADVEAHLLECDSCGSRLSNVIALAEGLRRAARAGDFRTIVNDALLQRAKENGLRVREYIVPRGGSVQCTVTDEDDLLVGRLEADLSGTARVDLSFHDASGAEYSRMINIPVEPGSTSVAFQESITALKGAPTMTMIARLLAVDDEGGEHVIGEYTFNHTRSIPGPAAW